jgi:hypothetical protein
MRRRRQYTSLTQSKIQAPTERRFRCNTERWRGRGSGRAWRCRCSRRCRGRCQAFRRRRSSCRPRRAAAAVEAEAEAEAEAEVEVASLPRRHSAPRSQSASRPCCWPRSRRSSPVRSCRTNASPSPDTGRPRSAPRSRRSAWRATHRHQRRSRRLHRYTCRPRSSDARSRSPRCGCGRARTRSPRRRRSGRPRSNPTGSSPCSSDRPSRPLAAPLASTARARRSLRPEARRSPDPLS